MLQKIFSVVLIRYPLRMIWELCTHGFYFMYLQSVVAQVYTISYPNAFI